jgi:hypothetical protein
LFKNVPRNKIQAGRGSARKRDSKVGSLMFMAIKKPADLSASRLGKSFGGSL